MFLEGMAQCLPNLRLTTSTANTRHFFTEHVCIGEPIGLPEFIEAAVKTQFEGQAFQTLGCVQQGMGERTGEIPSGLSAGGCVNHKQQALLLFNDLRDGFVLLNKGTDLIA